MDPIDTQLDRLLRVDITNNPHSVSRMGTDDLREAYDFCFARLQCIADELRERGRL